MTTDVRDDIVPRITNSKRERNDDFVLPVIHLVYLTIFFINPLLFSDMSVNLPKQSVNLS